MHFSAPLVAALAALAGTGEARRYVCDRQAYAAVAHHIKHPAFFCKMYLKEHRLNSPLPQFGPKQLTHLCHCFVQNSPRVKGPSKSPAAPKSDFANIDAPCAGNTEIVETIKVSFKNYVYFSKWFNKARRSYSPIPSIQSTVDIHVAAVCVIQTYNDNHGGGSNPNPPVQSSAAPQSTAAPTTSQTPASVAPPASTSQTPAASTTASTSSSSSSSSSAATASSASAPQLFSSSSVSSSTSSVSASTSSASASTVTASASASDSSSASASVSSSVSSSSSAQ